MPYGVTIRILLDVLAGLHAAHEMRDDHGDPLQIVHGHRAWVDAQDSFDFKGLLGKQRQLFDFGKNFRLYRKY